MKKSVNLDILRIIAALMVLSVHAGQIAGFSFDVGARGVELFFILSGYLALVSLEKNPSATSYYKKRVVRIVPLYWSCLVLLWIVNVMEAIYKGNVNEVLHGACGIRFLRYFAFVHMLIPSENWNMYNNMSALWTMSSFAVFYLMAPFLKRFIKNFYVSVICLAMARIMRSVVARVIVKLLEPCYPAEAHIDWFSSMNPLGQMYCFLMGVVVYYAIKEGKEALWMYILMILALTDITKDLWVLVFAIILLLTLKSREIIEYKKTKWISWLSGGTFALYLIHPMVFKFDIMLLQRYQVNHVLLRAGILYTTAILVAYLFYYGFVAKLEKRIYIKVFKE